MWWQQCSSGIVFRKNGGEKDLATIFVRQAQAKLGNRCESAWLSFSVV
jgi:hypothetical protein